VRGLGKGKVRDLSFSFGGFSSGKSERRKSPTRERRKERIKKKRAYDICFACRISRGEGTRKTLRCEEVYQATSSAGMRRVLYRRPNSPPPGSRESEFSHFRKGRKGGGRKTFPQRGIIREEEEVRQRDRSLINGGGNSFIHERSQALLSYLIEALE